VSKNLELRLEDLAALEGFRSALSLRSRGGRRDAGRMHILALRLGSWRGGLYAPRERSAKRGAARQRPAVERMPAARQEAARAGVEAGGWPVYLRQVDKMSRAGFGWLWPRAARPGEPMPASVKRGGAADLTRVVLHPRKRAVGPGQGRSFAPRPQSLSEAKARPMAGKMLARPSLLAPGGGEGGGEAQEVMFSVRQRAGEGRALRRGPSASRDAARGETAGFEVAAIDADPMPGLDFADALDDYFFRQSRLAPTGGTAFDPRLSPLWAGLKLPG